MKSETIEQQTDDQLDDTDVESPTPRKPPSYSMVDSRMMRIYLEFYRETYSSQHARLDRRTQELIAIAASLVAKCQGCLEGHIKKALKEGATKDEIAESIAIAMGVNAAAVVDLTDIAAARLNLDQFQWLVSYSQAQRIRSCKRFGFVDVFSKSKSGAVWMAWPEKVKHALVELDAVHKIEMLLERDESIVTYDPVRQLKKSL